MFINPITGSKLDEVFINAHQAVAYGWLGLNITLCHISDHLFSMTHTPLPRFCSNEAREMGICLYTPSGSKPEGVYKPHPALGG